MAPMLCLQGSCCTLGFTELEELLPGSGCWSRNLFFRGVFWKGNCVGAVILVHYFIVFNNNQISESSETGLLSPVCSKLWAFPLENL